MDNADTAAGLPEHWADSDVLDDDTTPDPVGPPPRRTAPPPRRPAVIDGAAMERRMHAQHLAGFGFADD